MPLLPPGLGFARMRVDFAPFRLRGHELEEQVLIRKRAKYVGRFDLVRVANAIYFGNEFGAARDSHVFGNRSYGATAQTVSGDG